MVQQTENAAIDRLAVFVGEWGIAAEFKDSRPWASAHGSSSSGCRAVGS